MWTSPIWGRLRRCDNGAFAHSSGGVRSLAVQKGSTGKEMFWRKKIEKPDDRTWGSVRLWVCLTEEAFNAKWEKSRESHPNYRQWFNDLIHIREELTKKGWLPPREKDVLARIGPERGILAGIPIKWSFERKYERDELSVITKRYHPDDPNDPY